MEHCKTCIEKNESYKELKKRTDNMSSDFKQTKESYEKLSKTINQYRDASRESEATISLLKETVMDKQMARNIHIDTIAKLKQDLEKARIEMERVGKNLISYSTASFVLDHILPKPTGKDEFGEEVYGYGNKGLGYHRVPPPIKESYSRKRPKGVEKALNLK
ncbi:hypothetical protein Hanom_Chr09g00810981 [Helianthus anomalus]